MASRVAVTGISGAIGAAVASEFLQAGSTVVGIDCQEPARDLRLELSDFVLADLTIAADVARIFGLGRFSALVHLAAIPSPHGAAPSEVFANNTAATFNVLSEAGRSGIRTAVLASSISVLGMVYAPSALSPLYAPIDESHTPRPEDAYALSKLTDEQTGAMMARTYGMTVLSFRFPYTASKKQVAERAAELNRDPSAGAQELWAYLDVRDAAIACLEGVRRARAADVTGNHVLNVVADDALVDGTVDELIRRFHPSTVIRAPIGRRKSAYDTSAAVTLLGFRARHLRLSATAD